MSVYNPTYKDKHGNWEQSEVYWYDFWFAGKRYRESAKTTRKTLAEKREKNRRLELERQFTTGARPQDPKRMLRTVKEAMEEYITAYDCPAHSEKAIAWVKERSPHILKHLGSIPLLDLGEDRIRDYMRKRKEEDIIINRKADKNGISEQTTRKPGNRTINMEIECLSRAVGSTWHQLWPNVPPLKERTDVGRALTKEEEGRLIWAAMENKSHYIETVIRIALATGMRSGEIRRLQLDRIDLTNKKLRVGNSKTPAGEGRGIPMNDGLYAAVLKQIDWLRETFGDPDPEWYLFPFCDRVKPIDPTRPVTTVKSAWESVRKLAGVNIRFHDLRHTTATKLAENRTPEATMKALMGHMSRAMLERYSHIRDEAKRTAVVVLDVADPIPVIQQKKKDDKKNRVPHDFPQVTKLRVRQAG